MSHRPSSVSLRRSLFILHWSLILLLLVSCSPRGRDVAPTFVPPPTAGASSGATYTVEHASITETFEARGRVEGKQEALLVFPLAGALKDVHVLPGDKVDEGDLLAELDAPAAKEEALRAQFDLELAEADLQIAELRLAQTKARITGAAQTASISTGLEGPYTVTVPLQTDLAPEVALARIGLERAEEELTQAAIEWDKALHRPWEPPEVRERYSQTLRSRQWDYQAARARLRQAERSLRDDLAILELDVERARLRVERARALSVLASEQLSNTLLTAPFSGVIISLDKTAGDWVRAYEPIAAIADPSELQVVATVLEEDIDRVAMGEPVTVQLDAYPDQQYTGSVLQIASEPIVWQGKNAYEVTITFDEGQEVPATIRMGADVTFAGRSRENVLVVPSQAIMTIGEQEVVEVVGYDGEIQRVEIETGISDGSQTEVTSGLQEGQLIRVP